MSWEKTSLGTSALSMILFAVLVGITYLNGHYWLSMFALISVTASIVNTFNAYQRTSKEDNTEDEIYNTARTKAGFTSFFIILVAALLFSIVHTIPFLGTGIYGIWLNKYGIGLIVIIGLLSFLLTHIYYLKYGLSHKLFGGDSE